MVYNGILMETIGIYVMVSIVFFFSRDNIISDCSKRHAFKNNIMGTFYINIILQTLWERYF